MLMEVMCLRLRRIAKMAGVEENDIDRLLVNPPEKVEIEVKYKIDVTVTEGVSQKILKKVILVLLKISRMIKSKCTFRFAVKPSIIIEDLNLQKKFHTVEKSP